MKKIYIIAVMVLWHSTSCFCQDDASDKKLLDSLIKADTFLSMLDGAGKQSSYVKINMGIGNRVFSLHNNSLNAMDQNRKLVITPSVEYFNKSGFGISAATYFMADKNNPGIYQYAFTPSYDFVMDKKIAAGISFTKFLMKDKYSVLSSPIQNDWSGYVGLKKTWLKPGLAVGYSTGTYHEINFVDTTVVLQNRPVRLQFTDTVNTTLKSFSLLATLSHTFTFYEILNGKDAFSFTPQIFLNAGAEKYSVTHKSSSKFSVPYRKKTRSRIRNFKEKTTPASFRLQSVGLNLDVNYTIGKFYFEPQLYLDYYLPSFTEKRFSQVFCFNVGCTF